MSNQLRRIAVIGGSRIPFCRSNSIYASKSNMDMLSASIQGLIDRFGLDGKQLDEVVAGAVTTHSKDWNLAREALLSTSLSPLTPGITLQQACGTSLQSAMMIGAKIASGQIDCGIAAGTDTDFRGEPFGAMPILMAVAEAVDKLHAICVVCGAQAYRNQRLIDGEPAHYDSPTIMVGGREKYEARCRGCHEVPKDDDLQTALL
jgi:hypothetical protein